MLSFARTIPVEDAKKQLPKLLQYCRSVDVVAAIPFLPKSLAAWKGYISLLPRSVVQMYSPEMARLVDNKIKSQKYDVMVVSEVSMPSVTSLIAAKSGFVPKVIDALEVGLAKDKYYTQISLNPRVRHGLTWLKFKRFTREILCCADACTVPSSLERDNLLEIVPNHPRIEIVPHCMDMTHYAHFKEEPRANTIVFTGSFTYHPNLDAVQFFFENIYSHIKASVPDVKVKIVGDTDDFPIDTLPVDERITFTGLLQDVRSTVANSWLSIVPLRFGAGTRLKIVESMALGTPVVSTSKGAEGLAVTHEKNILIADDPEQFAVHTVRLLKDPSLRRELSENGRRLVQKYYDWDVIGKQFNQLIESVVTMGRIK